MSEGVMVKGKKLSLVSVGMVAEAQRELSEAMPGYGKPGFQQLFQKAVTSLIARHVNGDWGDVDKHDARENEKALKTGARIVSAYTLFGVKLWVISDAAWYDDPLMRETTTILRPEDY